MASLLFASWRGNLRNKGGLDRAEKSVLVQAYSFTSAPIAEALVRAHKRGGAVQVILDRSQKTEKYSAADFLANSDISTRIDVAHAIAHNKVMIIDGKTVITGSLNFTKAAEERNSENLLIIHDGQLAARYTENWKLHQAHSAIQPDHWGQSTPVITCCGPTIEGPALSIYPKFRLCLIIR